MATIDRLLPYKFRVNSDLYGGLQILIERSPMNDSNMIAFIDDSEGILGVNEITSVRNMKQILLNRKHKNLLTRLISDQLTFAYENAIKERMYGERHV